MSSEALEGAEESKKKHDNTISIISAWGWRLPVEEKVFRSHSHQGSQNHSESR